MKRKAYQTLEDRGNANEIENNGPFSCDRKNAWLGRGYYFWDSFINNAHWWGQEGACYKDGYIICESSFELNDKCFDLYDNPEHIQQFKLALNLMKEKGLFVKNKTTVGRIIEFLKSSNAFFSQYEAIRVCGVNSKGSDSLFIERIPFKEGKKFQYLDISSPIQICFIKKEGLNREGFKIVYPSEYSEDYLV